MHIYICIYIYIHIHIHMHADLYIYISVAIWLKPFWLKLFSAPKTEILLPKPKKSGQGPGKVRFCILPRGLLKPPSLEPKVTTGRYANKQKRSPLVGHAVGNLFGLKQRFWLQNIIFKSKTKILVPKRNFRHQNTDFCSKTEFFLNPKQRFWF